MSSTIRIGYAMRMIIIAAVSLGLGLWGVYDYTVSIPRQQMLFERATLLKQCQAALETAQTTSQPNTEARAALEALGQELNGIIARHAEQLQIQIDPNDPTGAREQFEALQQSIESSEDVTWLAQLVVNVEGLNSRRVAGRLDESEQASQAHSMNEAALNAMGEAAASPPGAFDRLVQWAYMLCLPVAPYCLWLFVSTRRRSYRLDDDGTLHSPAGAWPADAIADIDMSRWTRKSIAHVVHTDGTRLELDDYRYQDLHLIVGAIASRLHPEAWTDDARPAKARSRPEASDAPGEGADETAPDEPADGSVSEEISEDTPGAV